MVKQWSKVGAVALGAFTFAAIPYLIAWDRLPDPLASHWGPTGQPDGSMPGWAGLLSTAALVVFAGLGLSILLARHVEGRRNPSPESLGLTSFVSALAVGLAWVTVYLNLDATSWEQAQRLSWWLVLVVVIVALVVVRPVTGWGGETSPFLELRLRGRLSPNSGRGRSLPGSVRLARPDNSSRSFPESSPWSWFPPRFSGSASC